MKRFYRTQPHLAKSTSEELVTHLEELCRRRISEVFQAVLEAEVDEVLERRRYERRSAQVGHRDGHDRPRTITSNRGSFDIARPRVRGVAFESVALPKHKRRLENVDKSLAELWIDGLATRDFEGTLRAFLGSEAPLSAATITRTNQRLSAELDAWNKRRFDDLDLVFSWADGVHLGAGPEDERRVFLTVIGADRLGNKHLLALREAMSESEANWEELFADLTARGLRAPQLLVADGAFGLWAAAGKAWPQTAQQRCWIHKMRNVEEKLPEKHRAAAHKAMSEIMYAESEPQARHKLERLAKSYEQRYPKAATCLRADRDRLFAFHRFPPATWIHLRTTNPIESLFSPIRRRTDAMNRLRTGKFANAVLYALANKLAKSWRRLHGYRELIDLPQRPLASKRAA